MGLRYRCLILDHDDTAVDSSREIHHPAHLQVMKEMRPDLEPISFEQWMQKNFHPGVMGYYRGELGMDDEEIQQEFHIWRRFTTTRIPHFFPGFIDILREFRKRGGIITVVSHSEKQLIERDYENRSGTPPLMPDMIFGWDFDETKRKPSIWPVERILETYGLGPGEALIVDDLKPGVVMGEAAGVSVAGAGWGYDIPEIRSYMESRCASYFTDISEFNRYLFDE